MCAGGKPAASPLAYPREPVGPNVVVCALANVLVDRRIVEEADALVLGDERGPVLRLLV